MVHVNDINYLVSHEEPLVETLPKFKNPKVADRIGFYASQLVDDGATFQIGFGHLPNTILGHLMDKHDLGIHTQLISDAFLPLFEKQVITNRKKTMFPGRTVASLCMGTEKLY